MIAGKMYFDIKNSNININLRISAWAISVFEFILKCIIFRFCYDDVIGASKMSSLYIAGSCVQQDESQWAIAILTKIFEKLWDWNEN